MPGKSKLRTLFERRTSQFNHLSDRILKKLEPVVLRACFDYMIKLHPMAATRIVWVGFFLTYHQDIDTVTLCGRIEFNEGDEYSDSRGNYFASLTQSEADYLSTVFQVVIPLELADNGTYDEIVEWLTNEDKKARQIIKEYLAQQDDTVQQDKDLIYEDTDLSEEEIVLAKLMSKNNNNILQ